MITFFKANISSTIASAFDYLIYILLVKWGHVDVVVSSALGTVSGGVLNFIIGRNWVFDGKSGKTHRQAAKYALVWSGNLVLNTAGVYLFTRVFHVHYALAKVIVSLIVAFGYNYTLQKNYVFKN